VGSPVAPCLRGLDDGGGASWGLSEMRRRWRRTETGHRRELEPEMGDREGGAQGMQKLTRNVGVGSDRAEEVEQ
jgi:hypothetical protein